METGTSGAVNLTNTTQIPDADYCRACNITAAFFVALLMALTLVGNGLVCASFYTFRDLRTLCNYYIISLCVADMLVAMIAMPFWLVLQLTNLNWVLGARLKLFWDCMDILCGTASIANLTAVSVDRMLAIAKPFKYPSLMTSKRAIFVIIAVWIYAILMGCLRVPQWPGKSYLHFVSTMSFFLPLSVVIMMYCVIFLVVRTQVKRIGKNQATEMKAAKTIAAVVGAFLICWLPFFIFVLGYAHNGTEFRPPPHLYEVIKWMEYLNSGLNPLIYTCMNRTFRRAFRRLFKRVQERMDPDYSRRGSTSYWQKGPRGSIINTTYSTCEPREDCEGV